MKCSVLALFLLFASGVSSLFVSINPTHMDAGVSGAVFRVICTTTEPLTHCHFKWRDIYNNDGPLLDLSEGPKTPSATNYSYSGNGLQKGECGISLNRPTGVQRWVVSCRVRSKYSGWTYAHMTLFAHLKSATSLTTSPRQITVRPGENVTVKCNAGDPLLGCAFRLPDGSLPTFNLGTRSPSTNSYSYSGSGLEQGECGISLHDVAESNNGFVWCQAWKNGNDEWRSFALTVAGPPSVPVLEIKPSNYSQGDVIKVTCTVTHALPTANMTWFLGEEVIMQDHVNEAPTEPWLWPFQVQTIKQTLKRQLISSDDGKEVTCKIKQVDDDIPDLQSSYTIAFHKEYTAPESVELKIESNISLEGDTLSATCTVKGGYPPAQVTWFLGLKNLTTKTVSVKNNVLVDSVTEQLRGEDDGSEVKCIVHHPSLSQPIQKTSVINIEYSPQITQKAVEQLRFKIGSPGVATVEFIANPRPSVSWALDDAVMEEGTTDVTGQYEAAILMKYVTNPNVWVAQLFINNVTLRDLKTVFFLNARNKFGGEYFRCVDFNTTESAAVIGQPKIMLRPVVNYLSVGSSINATCTVTRNRPIGAITWLLSNVTLTKGMNQPILLQTDPWGNHVIVHSITLQVREEDDGRQLKCIAGNRQTELNISVMYPPKKMASTIELYGFEIGKPGVLSVEILANPRPGLMWEVGGMLIREDEVTAAKRFHAPQALPIIHGKWVAKLFVTNITKQDIESDYALTARNLAGSRTYHVRLSTSQPVVSNMYSTTTMEEMTTNSVLTTPVATYVSMVPEYSGIATISDNGETSTKLDSSTKCTTLIAGQEEYLQTVNNTYRSHTFHPYLSIGNSIAILILGFLGSVLYRRLLQHLIHGSQGMERVPMCLENIYYNEVNDSERQRTDVSNHQDSVTGD